jgi:hypothetical protein
MSMVKGLLSRGRLDLRCARFYLPAVSFWGAEKVVLQAKSVPQRLKPDCSSGSYGTGEPVPLSKTEFSALFTEFFSSLVSRALKQNRAFHRRFSVEVLKWSLCVGAGKF